MRDAWWAGTSPEALFRSEDAGDAWHSISGFNDSQWGSGALPWAADDEVHILQVSSGG